MTHPLKTLWYTRCPHPSPLGLAAQLGWFLDEFIDDGIDVFTLQETENRRLRQSHLDHHLTNSFRQGGSAPAIWARARGADTRVIGFSWIDEYQAIIARAGSGIETPRDLAGRRLALPVDGNALIDVRRAEALRGFTVALDIAGLAESRVDFVDVPVVRPDRSQPLPRYAAYDRVVGALERREVDAIFVKGAWGLKAAHETDAQVVLDIHAHPDPLVRVNQGTPRPITVDSAILRNHPDIVARFLARVVEVGDWASVHPAETTHYVSRETKCTELWVAKAYGRDLHHRQRTIIDETCTTALSVYKDFLLRAGFISQDFSIAEWIDHEPLAAAEAHVRRRSVKRFLTAV